MINTITLTLILLSLPPQTNHTPTNFGTVATDIAQHLPNTPRYQNLYTKYLKQGDVVTAAHEWTHFINEYLSLQSGPNSSSFYLLNNKTITLHVPEQLRGIRPNVPPSLRGNLYQTYLVNNAQNATVDPLYLFDEWIAYLNDVTTAINQLEEKKPINTQYNSIQPHTAGNILEMMLYCVTLVLKIDEQHPTFFQTRHGKEMQDFLYQQTKRTFILHKKAIQFKELAQDDPRNNTLMKNLYNSPDTKRMREWIKTNSLISLFPDLK